MTRSLINSVIGVLSIHMLAGCSINFDMMTSEPYPLPYPEACSTPHEEWVKQYAIDNLTEETPIAYELAELPEPAIEKGVQGCADIKLTISPSGIVNATHILFATQPYFANTAKNAAQKVRFNEQNPEFGDRHYVIRYEFKVEKTGLFW